MKVGDGLAAVYATVIDYAVAILGQSVLFGDADGGEMYVSNKVTMLHTYLLHGFQMGLRDDQDVGRGGGVDVLKCEKAVILV